MPITQDPSLYTALIIVTLVVASIFMIVSIFGTLCWVKYDVEHSRRRRMFMVWIVIGGLLAVNLMVLLFSLWPREYPNDYRTKFEGVQKSNSLRLEASRVGIHIGGAIRYHPPMCDLHIARWELSSITPETALTWTGLTHSSPSPDIYNFQEADILVDDIRLNGQRIWGHALIDAERIPAGIATAIAAGNDPPTVARKLMRDHITTVMGHYRERVRYWTVVVGALTEEGKVRRNPFMDVLGEDYIPEAFRMARNVDGNAILYLAESFMTYDRNVSKTTEFLRLLTLFRSTNVPVDGVGIVSHGDLRIPDVSGLPQFLSAVADLRYSVEVTALDARLRLFEDRVDPYEAQGRYLAGWVRACLDQPVCTGVTFWGVSDATAWYETEPFYQWVRPNYPLLFDTRGYRKPGWYYTMEWFQMVPEKKNRSGLEVMMVPGKKNRTGFEGMVPFSTNFPMEEKMEKCPVDGFYPGFGKYIPKFVICSIFGTVVILLVIAVNSTKDRPTFQSEWWHQKRPIEE